MGNFKAVFLILLLQVLASASLASIELYSFHSSDLALPLVLPVRHSETPMQAFEKHQRTLNNTPDLVDLFEGRWPLLHIDSFQKIQFTELESSALLIANSAKDYTTSNYRITRFQTVFKNAGKKSLLLALTPTLGWNPTEAKEFQNLIAENAPLLVGMGGDDVSAQFYNQPDIHAKFTNPTRDREELSLLKTYFKMGRGFYLGVCRGSQLAAVALGYKLIQDLPTQVGSEVPHANDYHAVHPVRTTNQILKSVISKFEPNFYSFHHQAVIYRTGGPLELAAMGSDGVVEALEFKNGRGLLVQFHPEYTTDPVGQNFFNVLSNQNLKANSKSCEGAFL